MTNLLVDLLVQTLLFLVSYYVVICLSLELVRRFLSSTSYCVDRIGFTPFMALWVSRQHAKTRKEVPKDIFITAISSAIPNVLLLSITMFLHIFTGESFLLVYFILVTIFSICMTTIGFLVFLVRIITNPLSYSQRTFVNSDNKDEKAEYFHDSFTMEETYEVYHQKRIGLLSLSYLTYYYNLSTIMISGWIRIKRKITQFLSTYGFMIFLVPVFTGMILFTPATGDTTSESEPFEVGSTAFDRVGVYFSFTIILVMGWASIVIPMIGFFTPEVELHFELIVNKHNGNCMCSQQSDRCKTYLKLIVDSYRNFEDQMNPKKVKA